MIKKLLSIMLAIAMVSFSLTPGLSDMCRLTNKSTLSPLLLSARQVSRIRSYTSAASFLAYTAGTDITVDHMSSDGRVLKFDLRRLLLLAACLESAGRRENFSFSLKCAPRIMIGSSEKLPVIEFRFEWSDTVISYDARHGLAITRGPQLYAFENFSDTKAVTDLYGLVCAVADGSLPLLTEKEIERENAQVYFAMRVKARRNQITVRGFEKLLPFREYIDAVRVVSVNGIPSAVYVLASGLVLIVQPVRTSDGIKNVRIHCTGRTVREIANAEGGRKTINLSGLPELAFLYDLVPDEDLHGQTAIEYLAGPSNKDLSFRCGDKGMITGFKPIADYLRTNSFSDRAQLQIFRGQIRKSGAAPLKRLVLRLPDVRGNVSEFSLSPPQSRRSGNAWTLSMKKRDGQTVSREFRPPIGSISMYDLEEVYGFLLNNLPQVDITDSLREKALKGRVNMDSVTVGGLALNMLRDETREAVRVATVFVNNTCRIIRVKTPGFDMNVTTRNSEKGKILSVSVAGRDGTRKKYETPPGVSYCNLVDLCPEYRKFFINNSYVEMKGAEAKRYINKMSVTANPGESIARKLFFTLHQRDLDPSFFDEAVIQVFYDPAGVRTIDRIVISIGSRFRYTMRFSTNPDGIPCVTVSYAEYDGKGTQVRESTHVFASSPASDNNLYSVSFAGILGFFPGASDYLEKYWKVWDSADGSPIKQSIRVDDVRIGNLSVFNELLSVLGDKYALVLSRRPYDPDTAAVLSVSVNGIPIPVSRIVRQDGMLMAQDNLMFPDDIFSIKEIAAIPAAVWSEGRGPQAMGETVDAPWYNWRSGSETVERLYNYLNEKHNTRPLAECPLSPYQEDFSRKYKGFKIAVNGLHQFKGITGAFKHGAIEVSIRPQDQSIHSEILFNYKGTRIPLSRIRLQGSRVIVEDNASISVADLLDEQRLGKAFDVLWRETARIDIGAVAGTISVHWLNSSSFLQDLHGYLYYKTHADEFVYISYPNINSVSLSGLERFNNVLKGLPEGTQLELCRWDTDPSVAVVVYARIHGRRIPVSRVRVINDTVFVEDNRFFKTNSLFSMDVPVEEGEWLPAGTTAERNGAGLYSVNWYGNSYNLYSVYRMLYRRVNNKELHEISDKITSRSVRIKGLDALIRYEEALGNNRLILWKQTEDPTVVARLVIQLGNGRELPVSQAVKRDGMVFIEDNEHFQPEILGKRSAGGKEMPPPLWKKPETSEPVAAASGGDRDRWHLSWVRHSPAVRALSTYLKDRFIAEYSVQWEVPRKWYVYKGPQKKKRVHVYQHSRLLHLGRTHDFLRFMDALIVLYQLYLETESGKYLAGDRDEDRSYDPDALLGSVDDIFSQAAAGIEAGFNRQILVIVEEFIQEKKEEIVQSPLQTKNLLSLARRILDREITVGEDVNHIRELKRYRSLLDNSQDAARVLANIREGLLFVKKRSFVGADPKKEKKLNHIFIANRLRKAVRQNLGIILNTDGSNVVIDEDFPLMSLVCDIVSMRLAIEGARNRKTRGRQSGNIYMADLYQIMQGKGGYGTVSYKGRDIRYVFSPAQVVCFGLTGVWADQVDIDKLCKKQIVQVPGLADLMRRKGKKRGKAEPKVPKYATRGKLSFSGYKGGGYYFLPPDDYGPFPEYRSTRSVRKHRGNWRNRLRRILRQRRDGDLPESLPEAIGEYRAGQEAQAWLNSVFLGRDETYKPMLLALDDKDSVAIGADGADSFVVKLPSSIHATHVVLAGSPAGDETWKLIVHPWYNGETGKDIVLAEITVGRNRFKGVSYVHEVDAALRKHFMAAVKAIVPGECLNRVQELVYPALREFLSVHMADPQFVNIDRLYAEALWDELKGAEVAHGRMPEITDHELVGKVISNILAYAETLDTDEEPEMLTELTVYTARLIWKHWYGELAECFRNNTDAGDVIFENIRMFLGQYAGAIGQTMISDALTKVSRWYQESLSIKNVQMMWSFNRRTRDELELYQAEGIRRFAEKGRVVIGDEMRLGKSLQALAGACMLSRHALVITPAMTLQGWVEEILRRFGGFDGEDGLDRCTLKIFTGRSSAVDVNAIIQRLQAEGYTLGNIRVKQIQGLANIAYYMRHAGEEETRTIALCNVESLRLLKANVAPGSASPVIIIDDVGLNPETLTTQTAIDFSRFPYISVLSGQLVRRHPVDALRTLQGIGLTSEDIDLEQLQSLIARLGNGNDNKAVDLLELSLRLQPVLNKRKAADVREEHAVSERYIRTDIAEMPLWQRIICDFMETDFPSFFAAELAVKRQKDTGYIGYMQSLRLKQASSSPLIIPDIQMIIERPECAVLLKKLQEAYPERKIDLVKLAGQEPPAKYSAVRELAHKITSDGNKLIIYTAYVDTADKLYALLTAELPGRRIGLIHGAAVDENNRRSRGSVLEQYKRGQIDIVIATMPSVEKGIAMKADAIIYVENPSSAGAMQQLNARAKDPYKARDDSVPLEVYMLRTPVDAEVWDRILKQNALLRVVDGEIGRQDVMDGLHACSIVNGNGVRGVYGRVSVPYVHQVCADALLEFLRSRPVREDVLDFCAGLASGESDVGGLDAQEAEEMLKDSSYTVDDLTDSPVFQEVLHRFLRELRAADPEGMMGSEGRSARRNAVIGGLRVLRREGTVITITSAGTMVKKGSYERVSLPDEAPAAAVCMRRLRLREKHKKHKKEKVFVRRRINDVADETVLAFLKERKEQKQTIELVDGLGRGEDPERLGLNPQNALAMFEELFFSVEDVVQDTDLHSRLTSAFIENSVVKKDIYTGKKGEPARKNAIRKSLLRLIRRGELKGLSATATSGYGRRLTRVCFPEELPLAETLWKLERQRREMAEQEEALRPDKVDVAKQTIVRFLQEREKRAEILVYIGLLQEGRRPVEIGLTLQNAAEYFSDFTESYVSLVNDSELSERVGQALHAGGLTAVPSTLMYVIGAALRSLKADQAITCYNAEGIKDVSMDRLCLADETGLFDALSRLMTTGGARVSTPVSLSDIVCEQLREHILTWPGRVVFLDLARAVTSNPHMIEGFSREEAEGILLRGFLAYNDCINDPVLMTLIIQSAESRGLDTEKLQGRGSYSARKRLLQDGLRTLRSKGDIGVFNTNFEPVESGKYVWICWRDDGAIGQTLSTHITAARKVMAAEQKVLMMSEASVPVDEETVRKAEKTLERNAGFFRILISRYYRLYSIETEETTYQKRHLQTWLEDELGRRLTTSELYVTLTAVLDAMITLGYLQRPSSGRGYIFTVKAPTEHLLECS